MKLKNLRIRLVKPDSFAYTGTMKNTDTKIQETIEYYKARNEKLEIEKEALEAKLKWYEEQFRLSQQRRFGSSSEKTNSDQLSLLMKLKLPQILMMKNRRLKPLHIHARRSEIVEMKN